MNKHSTFYYSYSFSYKNIVTSVTLSLYFSICVPSGIEDTHVRKSEVVLYRGGVTSEATV